MEKAEVDKLVAAINQRHKEYIAFIGSLTRPACKSAASFSKAQAENLIAGHRDGCDAAVYEIVKLAR